MRIQSFVLCSLLFCSIIAAGSLQLKRAPRKLRLPKKEPVIDYGFKQVKFINEQIANQWKDNNIVPSPPCTDAEWCRRVYLDVIGRVPSVDELHSFVNNKDPMRKAKLVDQLLNDDKYVDEYARNWTTIWTNILIGRNGGTEQNTLISRAGMQKFLRDSFARNKPYNLMVKELVIATGGTAPGTKDFNGATNFLVANWKRTLPKLLQ